MSIHTLDRRDFVIWAAFGLLIGGMAVAAGYWSDSLDEQLFRHRYPTFIGILAFAAAVVLLAPPALARVAGAPLARGFALGSLLSALALLGLVAANQFAASLPRLPWPATGALAGLLLGLAWAAALRAHRLRWLAACAVAGVVAALFAVANSGGDLIDIGRFGLLWAPLTALPLGWLLRLSYPAEGDAADQPRRWAGQAGDSWRRPVADTIRGWAEDRRPGASGGEPFVARLWSLARAPERPLRRGEPLRSTPALLALGLPTLALVAGAAILGESLRPCAWIDRALDRSGCAGRIAIVQPAERAFVITDITYTPDGQTLLVGGGDSNYGELRFYRVADGALLRSMPLASQPYQIAVLPNKTQLISYDLYDLMAIYDLGSGQELRRIQVNIPLANRFNPAFSADGRFMRSGFELIDLTNGTIVSDADKGELLQRYPELQVHQEGFADLSTTPDERLRTVLIARADRNLPETPYSDGGYDLALVDAATVEPGIGRVDDLGPGAIRMAGPISDLTDLSFSPDGTLLMAQYNDYGIRSDADQRAGIRFEWIRVWRLSDGATVLATTLDGIQSLARPVWSPDSRTIAVPSGLSREVQLYPVR